MINKKIPTVIGALVVLTIAGFLGYAFLMESKDEKESATVNTDTTPLKRKSVSIKKIGEINYVIYTDEKGDELIIDESPWNADNWEKEGRDVTEYVIFSEAKFSPNENFILYKAASDERGPVVQIYDISNNKHLEGMSGNIVDFTPDEKYLFACDYEFGFYKAKIYSLPTFTEIFDLFGTVTGQYETEFYNGSMITYCTYENTKNNVIFHLENIESSNLNVSKDIYFNLDSKKATEEYLELKSNELISKQIN